MTRIHLKNLKTSLCLHGLSPQEQIWNHPRIYSRPFKGAGRYCIRGLGRIHGISQAQTYLKRKVTPSFQQTKVWLFAIGIQFNKFDLWKKSML